MGFQVGLYYFDGREVSESEAATLRGWFVSTGYEPFRNHRQPGLFLAYASYCCNRPRPAETQPCLGPAGVLTFDGRLDNRQHVTADAAAGDPALALAAYETWGADGFAQLLGDWSLALWDSRSNSIVLASDFAGVRPLYYCGDRNRVTWSTRLRPLVDWVQAAEIDDQYVAGFLAYGGCPNRTPYRGVFSVPPGHAVLITSQGARTRKFWNLPMGETIRYRREEEYEEQLGSLFREAVRCRLPLDAACLCELSGGLDSSSVVSVAADILPPGRLLTLSFEHEGSIDKPFYTALEAFCGVQGNHIATADYPFLTDADPGGALPAFWAPLLKRVAALAREIGASTYLTGQLGDLIMGNWLDDSEQVAGLLRSGRVGAALRQALAWSKAMRIPVIWVLWRAFQASLPPRVVPGRWSESAGGAESGEKVEDSIARAFRKRTGLAGSRTFFSQDWMHARPERRKHFRSLMQTLELRRLQTPEPFDHFDYAHPYTHRPLVTFMLSIPADMVCRPGEPRRLMRRAFHEFWPPKLRQRRSKEAYTGVFLKSLIPLAAAMLQRDQPLHVVERGYIDRESLERRLQRMTMSLSCNEPQLRNIILLEFWLRRHFRTRFAPQTAIPGHP